MNAENKLSIKKFYENKTIFITGITGFVGKVLLVKLLQEFSTTVKRIYVLIRDKYSETAEQRFEKIVKNSPIFQSFNNNISDIVHVINGNIVDDNLSLSDVDLDRILNEVDIVIHSAANVNFNGVLNKFIEQNVVGTDLLLNLCNKMKNIKSIVYVSTAYGNCHLKEIEEKIYPFNDNYNFDKYLRLVREKFGETDLQIGHPILNGRPNPYTLSKSLAEWMIEEKYPNLPIIICRPSIVSNSMKEPIPGWCDSTAGCAGVVILTTLGIARSFIFDAHRKANLIPVEIVVNSLIISAAYRASSFYNNDKKVIHITLDYDNSLTWGQYVNISKEFAESLPPVKIIRPIRICGNKHQTLIDRTKYKISMVFSHYLFGFMLDLICVLTGHKPFMTKLIKRLDNNSQVLKPFSCNEWNFHTNNLKSIDGLLLEEDRESFYTNTDKIDWRKYLYDFVHGCRCFILKDPDSTLKIAIERHHRIKYILITTKIIISLIFYYLLRTTIINLIINPLIIDSLISIMIVSYFINFYG